MVLVVAAEQVETRGQVLVGTNSFLSRLKDEGQERRTIKFGARATANLGVL